MTFRFFFFFLIKLQNFKHIMIVYTYYVGGFYPADCRGLTETPNDDDEEYVEKKKLVGLKVSPTDGGLSP